MDPNALAKMLQEMDAGAPAQTPTAAPAPASPPEGTGMISQGVPGGPEQVNLDVPLGGAPAAPAPQVAPATQAPQAPAAAGPRMQERPGGLLPQPEGPFTEGRIDPLTGGFMRSIFETKDFFTGVTPQADRSDIRRFIDMEVDEQSKDSMAYGVTAGVSQFMTGMVGLGKILKGARAVGLVGTAASKGAKFVEGLAKGAAVGAASFDPHGQRLSNLVESYPELQNPITGFLQSKKGDSAELGRFKNALEGLGMDLGTAGALWLGTRIFKAAKSGASDLLDRALRDADREVSQAERAADAEAATMRPPSPEPAAAPEVTAPRVEGEPPPRAEGEAPRAEGDVPPAGPEPSPTGTQNSEYGPYLGMVDDMSELRQSDTGLPDGAPRRRVFRPESLDDATMGRIIDNFNTTSEALETHGTWNNAVGSGEVRFDRDVNIPWQAMVDGAPGGTEVRVQAFIQRLAEAIEVRTNAVKGGTDGVLSDQQLYRDVAQRMALMGEDPAAVLGAIQQAGRNARHMVTYMKAGLLASQRAMVDLYNLSAQLRSGYVNPERFGSLAEAQLAMRQMAEVAATTLNASMAMRASAGRTMRSLRQEFRDTMGMVEQIRAMDPDMMAQLFSQTGGDPRRMRRALTMMNRTMDMAQYFYVNNLLWGLKTHVANITTNFYMLAGRPLERIIGGVGQAAMERNPSIALDTFRKNTKQYAHMVGAVHDAWNTAFEAFRLGDSILTPHNTELSSYNNSLGAQIAQAQYVPMDGGIQALMHNATLFGLKMVGMPTRAMGGVDEFMRVLVYRSKIAADAWEEGATHGMSRKDIGDLITRRVDEGFDADGRAVNLEALQEARINTFQQDLLPGTMGHSVQLFAARHPSTRFILPFIKTPTNVFRYGIKMTPGLNMLQDEYRRMLLGQMGQEAQQQAIGQVSMGTLIMTAAATLAHQGTITGAAPTDPKLASALQATGWRPYSMVRVGKDGTTTYIPYNSLDPVMMPFGMVADMVNIAQNHNSDDDSSVLDNVGVAVLMSLVKNLNSKGYLKGLNDALTAFKEPGDSASDSKLGKAAGTMAGNLVPFSSMLRQLNPDPHLREARGFTDTIMRTIPGLSSELPAKRDAVGEPITVTRGLWVTAPGDIVNAELRRLGDDWDRYIAPVSPSLGGVDLREVKLKDGTNAFERYNELVRQPSKSSIPLRDQVEKVIKSPGYRKLADDGDGTTKGSKLWAIMKPIAAYREAAQLIIRSDPNVAKAMGKKMETVQQGIAANKLAEEAKQRAEEDRLNALKSISPGFPQQ